MKLKKFMAAALAFAVAVSSTSFSGTKTEKVEAAEAWSLVWSDEFEGTSLDTNTWNYEIGNGNWGWGNGEKQYYTDRTENVEVSDGTLKIKALKENYGNCNYTSGRITTQGKKDFKYGRIEARIKLPSFSGSWPAFWMLGANYSQVGWPRCGEIDIMEAINTENFTNGALHWYVDSGDYVGQGDSGDSAEGKTPEGYNRTDWHTYGIEWDEQRIQFYIDDVVFYTQGISASTMSEFRKNQYIILNLAIGGQWPGYTIDDSAFPNNSKMEVDYVRVYQQEEVPTETTTFDGETVVSYETVDSVAVNTGTMGTYFGGQNNWGSANGTVSEATNTGITINATSVGDNLWQIQSYLKNLRYVPGNTYTYKCTITSDVTKSVRVKVVGEGDDYIFSQDDITVQAGIPYYYEKQVTIPEDYNFEGTLDLFFGLGKNNYANESIAENTTMTITISDMSFVTEEKNITYIPAETTEKQVTTTTTDIAATTKKNTTTNVKKPARAKIKKVVSRKKSLKIKIKKVKRAKGYQIRYSTNKKFKKYKTKYTKSLKYTIKKLKANKEYYVKVRAYVLNSKGKKVFGRFSKVKKAKTK